MDVTSIFGNDYTEFCETDPYNIHNQVSGYICRKQSNLYGALLIEKINNKPVTQQLIMCTPKMHYPFDSREDGTRKYFFPSAKSIDVYEKLDGTNILAYFYYDDNGNRFLSFKTRLRPFLGSGTFGDFFNMFNEVAKDKFNAIKRIMIHTKCNLSFELYGARNPHLIMYSNSLNFALLFGVTGNGNILSPNDLSVLVDGYSDVKFSDIPVVSKISSITRDYIYNYEILQKELEIGLIKQEGEYYSGKEGTVWYFKTIDNITVQYKCKPETIEMIHFSAGAGGLCKNSVLATCWNALENVDTLTIDIVKKLLIEEFKPEIVESKHNLINECISYVQKEAEFRHSVISDYKNIGINILLDKRTVMREMSKKYPSEKMGKVYSIINNLS